MQISKFVMSVTTLGILALGPACYAFPIAATGTEGSKILVASTADVIATYEGNSAAYSNDLYLMLDSLGNPADDGVLTNDRFVFNNHSSSVGSVVNLGSFSVGTELIFRLHVNNTGNDFFTGPASRNPDGHSHARVEENWKPSTTLVSFEDLFNGPFVYNDLSFSFSNTQTSTPVSAVPAPSTLALAILGLTGLIGLSWRRNGTPHK